jgi:hypothetical protein
MIICRKLLGADLHAFALDCAADTAVEPATLIRAARDFTTKDPTFAAMVALQAIAHRLAGRGYEAIPSDLDVAASHLLAATTKLDQLGWALQTLRRLETAPPPHADGLMMLRLRATITIFENAVV